MEIVSSGLVTRVSSINVGRSMFVDAHVHFDSTQHHQRLIADMELTGATQFCVLVIERFDESPNGFKQGEALWLKLREPKRAFVFGGLDYTGLTNGGPEPEFPLVDQVKTIRKMGLDGVKLISGKPNVRQAIRHALDGLVFDSMFQWLEETGFPLLWHVSDPPEFWHKDQVPRWARDKGWWYGDDVPKREQIETEVFNVFARHPKLNLVLPHFFFFSDRLEEATRLLEQNPTFNLDLAPGVEMLHNFTAHRDEARDFFLRFADRIIFGTDIGLLEHCNSPLRGVMVRRFLESEDVFPVPDDPVMTPDDRPALHGLGLPKNVVQRITSANFYRVVGRSNPQELDAPTVRHAMQDLVDRSRRHNYNSDAAEMVLRELT